MSDRKPFSLIIVIVVLLVFGGVFYYAIDNLSKELTNVPHSAKGQPSGTGNGTSPAALKAAMEKGDIGAIKAEIAKGGAANTINSPYPLLEGRRQISLLTYAAMQGKADLVRALIDAGARTEPDSDDFGTPLMMAAAKGDLATLKELLKAGAKVDDRNKWGETALIKASTLGNAEGVRALLDGGASVKITDADGNTPLALAAGSEAPAAIVKMLIDAKADVDSTNRDGVTPLMQAAKLGDLQKCVMLLDAGAKATLKDNNNWTAKEWANQRQDESGKKCEELLAQAAR
jgi:ankyrin repeat protein